jgi:hypothetical protein
VTGRRFVSFRPRFVAARGTRTGVRGFLQAKENVMPRELIETGTDKRFVRRDKKGRFKESDDVGRSLTGDRRRHAKTRSKKGEGDRGDR